MGRSCDAETPEQLAEHRGVDPSSLRAPEHDPAAAVELPGFLEDLEGAPGQGNPVLAKTALNGDPGLPFAVSMASKRSSPPLTSHAPGSSQIAQGQPTSPNAARALEPITLNRVRVEACEHEIRLAESVKE